ncbi:MAG: sialidase family protein, partial [Kiritimatiellae bacterium]|nr:sialidase family protein [Kiritimatiellia bacterium]
HAWRLQGLVPYSGDVKIDPQAERRDGFTEPDYEFMPDGAIICLMRTSDGCGVGPLLLTRSTDGARTWSKPTRFDAFGKMPQLMTLKDGTTLASYGQSGGPGYFVVRATRDRAGLTWGEPTKITYSPRGGDAWDSCGHTEMVPLDDHTALIVYSDFNTPNDKGVKRKTILVRRITTSSEAAATSTVR